MDHDGSGPPLPLLWALCRPLARAQSPAEVLDAATRALVAQPGFRAGCAHLFDTRRPGGGLVSAVGLTEPQMEWALSLCAPGALLELANMHGGPYPLSDLALLEEADTEPCPGPGSAVCIPVGAESDDAFAVITLVGEPGPATRLEPDWHLYAIAGHIIASSLGRALCARGLSDQVRFLQFVIDLIPSPIYFRDRTGVCTGCNAEFAQLVGRPHERIVGAPALEAAGQCLPGPACESDEAVVAEGLTDVVEVRLVCSDGDPRDFILRRAPYLDERDAVGGLVGVLTDITEHKRTEEELRLASQSDPLTGLANRRTFEQRLEAEWKRSARAHRPLSLLMVDIDHFKEYNDLYGHLQGDDCLRLVSEILERTFRRSCELVARWGGEEFTVVLAETRRRDVIMLAEKLRRSVEDAAIPRAGRATRVTVSVGVATLQPTPEGHPLDLVSLADEAMYRSKRQGRNRVTVSAEAAVF